MQIETLELTANAGRESRTLMQFDIAALGKILGHEPLFPYLVTMLPGQAVAGNHYHHHKEEIFICVRGSLLVALKDPQNKDSAEIVLRADDRLPSPALRAVVIRSGLAHAVRNVGDGVASLLVFATRIARDPNDDFPCDVLTDLENIHQ